MTYVEMVAGTGSQVLFWDSSGRRSKGSATSLQNSFYAPTSGGMRGILPKEIPPFVFFLFCYFFAAETTEFLVQGKCLYHIQQFSQSMCHSNQFELKIQKFFFDQASDK